MTHLDLTPASFEMLEAALADVDAACRALPVQEQDEYWSAQESVVEARRSAETHEGLLQVC